MRSHFTRRARLCPHRLTDLFMFVDRLWSKFNDPLWHLLSWLSEKTSAMSAVVTDRFKASCSPGSNLVFH